MLAYTNRFLAISSITRSLYNRYKSEGGLAVRRQIENLRSRLKLIRRMQSLGILSLFACILSAVALFLGKRAIGEFLFGLSLLLMLGSLLFCLLEIQLSGQALEIELEDMEKSSFFISCI